MTLRGIVRNQKIEILGEHKLAEGVEVEITPKSEKPRVWGDGIRNSAGAAAGLPGAEEAWREVERYRKTGGYRDIVE